VLPAARVKDTILTHSDHVADRPMPLEARSSGPLIGQVRVPGDKSISHRALILGALAVGQTRVSGLLEGEDVLNTAKAMRALGAQVDRTGEFAWSVRGVGVAGFAQPQAPLDFGNSGTGCRLVMGAVAGCPILAVFDGDASLRGRPMRRVLDPLELMGARVGASGEGGRLPLTLNGSTARRWPPPRSSRRCCWPGWLRRAPPR
jgi:3-phosphoshikimate 1-carboxyvinyltransferase